MNATHMSISGRRIPVFRQEAWALRSYRGLSSGRGLLRPHIWISVSQFDSSFSQRFSAASTPRKFRDLGACRSVLFCSNSFSACRTVTTATSKALRECLDRRQTFAAHPIAVINAFLNKRRYLFVKLAWGSLQASVVARASFILKIIGATATPGQSHSRRTQFPPPAMEVVDLQESRKSFYLQ